MTVLLRMWTVASVLIVLAPQLGAQSTNKPRSQRAAKLSSDVSALDYAIGAGDVLQVLAWQEPDFSGEFLVRYDGKLTIPIVGDVSVSGLTPEQVSRLLEGQLSRYIETARVTVTVAQPNSAQIFIIGKVAKQGAFPYIGPLRVVQALALAGGFQEFAKLDRIFVIREVGGNLIYLPVNYDDLIDQRKLGANFHLLPRDTIVVP